MRMTALLCVLSVTSQLAGCGSTSKESGSSEGNQTSLQRLVDPDLLSPDAELFPLSTFFGVCARRAHALRATYSNGMRSNHFPTYVEITGDGGLMKITVGQFGFWPGTVLRDITATSPPRRIQITDLGGDKTVLVSDFTDAGKNRVDIDYDETDPEAQAAAIRLANSVVSCHVSATVANSNNKR